MYRRSPSATPTHPRLFIGSSTEGLPLAEALQFNLDHEAEVTVWNQGLFWSPRTVLERLERVVAHTDFAAFVLTPDDIVTKRGLSAPAPRDNLVFEIGFFIARLGRDRTFLIVGRGVPLMLPSDLDGLLVLPYRLRTDGNQIAATASAAMCMRQTIRIVGTIQNPPDAAGTAA